jgi:hypothetical protein
MNKRRILIVAMVLAALIAAALLFVPGLKRSGVTQLLYLPAALMALVLSGGSHSPSAAAWNSAFAAYSVAYLFSVVVLYALLLELYLLMRATRSLGWPEEVVGAAPDPVDDRSPAGVVSFATAGVGSGLASGRQETEALVTHLGRNLQDHERRRRSHWLLVPRDIHLDAAPADAARRILNSQAAPRSMAWLLRRLEARGTATIGAEKARQAMARAFGQRR